MATPHPVVSLLSHQPWIMDAYAAEKTKLTRERIRQIRNVIHPIDRPDTLVTALRNLSGTFPSIARVAEAVHSRSGYLVHYGNAYEQVAVELARLIPGEEEMVSCSRCERRIHRWELGILSGSSRTSWCRSCDQARELVRASR